MLCIRILINFASLCFLHGWVTLPWVVIWWSSEFLRLLVGEASHILLDPIPAGVVG